MRSPQKMEILGRTIGTDPNICHGKPVFRGTRSMVWQVLEMVAEGKARETIVVEWGGRHIKRRYYGGGHPRQ
jgi:uncharacterized protein (DUF433 family)